MLNLRGAAKKMKNKIKKQDKVLFLILLVHKVNTGTIDVLLTPEHHMSFVLLSGITNYKNAEG